MVLGVMNEWVTQELRANLNQNDVVEEMLRNSSLNCVLLDQGRYNDAVVCGERALECAKLVLGKRDPELGVYMSNLADAYLHAGRCKEALDLYESCLELETGLLAEGDRRIGFTMNGLSMVYLKIGRLDDALRMCQRALEFRRRFLPPSHPDLLDSMSNLATVYSKLNRDAEALIMHESAVEFALQHLPPSHPNTAAAMGGLGLRYYALGRHSDALRLFESAFEIEQQVLPPDHPVLHQTMQCLAETYRSLSRHSDELTMCKAILEFRQKFLGQGIPELASLNHRVHGLQIAIQDSAAHADSVRHMQDAGSVVITRHRGGGYASPDYSLHFRDDFDTFVADIMLCGGCFYWEIQVVEMPAQNQVFQFGVCTDGFEARQIPDGEGAGDDAKSWAVDGTRQLMWHKGRAGPYGSSWRFGDVIGFALDMRTSGAAVLSVSVNGSFASPNGAAFTSIDAPYLSPAFSGARGRCLLNLGSRPFVHAVNAEYTSVLAFHRKQQQ
jgi:tetratricopeptide (TPR) repeat protein